MIPPELSILIFVLFSAAFVVFGLWKFARGIDGLYSATNIQVILWTGVVLAGYLSLAILKGGFLESIPTNLIYLMGISVGSTVAAAGIRATQEPRLLRKWSPRGGYKTKKINGEDIESVASPKIVTGGLLNSEKAPTELSVAKMQMMAWTIVSLAIFTILTLSNILSNNLTLPDVETGLLALMGVSHAGYNGNKIGDKPPKQLTF
jgi:hypothetical protein